VTEILLLEQLRGQMLCISLKTAVCRVFCTSLSLMIPTRSEKRCNSNT